MSTKAVWKCMVKGYKQIVGHMAGHFTKGTPKKEREYALIDTGKVLANKIGEAREKVFWPLKSRFIPSIRAAQRILELMRLRNCCMILD